MSTKTDHFPTDVAGLPDASGPEVVELGDGDRFELRVAPVAKRLGGQTVRMLGYNGSVPGPTLRVPEGSEIVVDVVNDGDLETTVHWHGLRLDNRYDGTHETGEVIPMGGRDTVRVSFPDPGIYWYHPHVREDYGQELGMYGNVIVVPREEGYWAPAHRELALTLDDVLIEDGAIAPFSRSETNYAAMGRFGDVLLVSGSDELALSARRGEVVRLFLTNTANTRVFKVALPGARMKLVGGDSGRAEREELVDELVIAPSERLAVDVLFESAGSLTLEHRTPDRVYPLASIEVDSEAASPLDASFSELRTDPELAAERAGLATWLDAEPDKRVAFIAEMDMGAMEGDFVCPMHLDVTSPEPGHCSKCGMKLLPQQLVEDAGGGHEHHDMEHDHSAGDGIEWEDDMVEVNRLTTPENMRWKLIDRDTGAENQAIDWRFRVGDRVKIRLLNEMAGDHPMHHPFHIHGAGRFLVLSRDGEPESNLMWHDTVLVPAGQTVDILLDVTNPGVWMSHCHIAEHHESGMMFSFVVEE